jgi:hypothetical protein
MMSKYSTDGQSGASEKLNWIMALPEFRYSLLNLTESPGIFSPEESQKFANVLRASISVMTWSNETSGVDLYLRLE